jgi:phage baseplate assembly protein W
MRNSLANAIWIDANPKYGLDTLPDRLPDAQAINCSLYNLFNCAPGQRSRIFQPTYGSLWLSFIHEPINDITAMKMQVYMIDAIKQWEPRIELDLRNTGITPDLKLPGYIVRVAFASNTGQHSINFQMTTA